MTVESKIIVSAEDRTRAAFASIERNTGKTVLAMAKLQGQLLKLAGAGTLVAFFKSNAQSTEKWRDEMARLDAITEKFFKNAADAGRLDPFVKMVKGAYVVAFGAATAIENLGLAIGSLGAATVAAAKLNFAEAGRIIDLSSQDIAENEERFLKLKEDLFKDAPQGYAKQREEEAARIKEAARKLKEAETERRKATLEHAKPAEDAFRAESEISDGQTAAGLTLLGDNVVNERIQKEQEILDRESEMRAAQREKDIQALLESQLTESELADAQHAADLQTLYDARNAEYLTEAQFKQSREQLELEHQAKLGDIHAQAELARRDFSKLTFDQQLATANKGFGLLANLMQSKHKEMFNIGKAGAIAQAAIATRTGAIEAYKALAGIPIVGPALGAAAAVAVTAFGLEQISNIKSTSFGSAPGGGAVPTVSVNPNTGIPTGTPGDGVDTLTNVPPQTTVQINIAGNVLGNEEFVRETLIPALRAEINGRDIVFINSNSRQAQELAST